MGKTAIRNVCKVSFDKPAAEQPNLHASPPSQTAPFPYANSLQQNRWHPDSTPPLTPSPHTTPTNTPLPPQVPSTAAIKDGETVKIECLDWTGGQIENNDCADDVKNVDLTRVHYLSGPFDVEGAEPGDVLLVEIMDVQPFEERPWGFTGIFDKGNGVSSFFPVLFVKGAVLFRWMRGIGGGGVDVKRADWTWD